MATESTEVAKYIRNKQKIVKPLKKTNYTKICNYSVIVTDGR